MQGAVVTVAHNSFSRLRAAHSAHTPVHDPLAPVCQAADEVQRHCALADARRAGDHHAEAILRIACSFHLQNQVHYASVAGTHHDALAQRSWHCLWQLWHHEEVAIWVSRQHSLGKRQQLCKSAVAGSGSETSELVLSFQATRQ